MDPRTSNDGDNRIVPAEPQQSADEALIAGPMPPEAERYISAFLRALRHWLRNFFQSVAYSLLVQLEAESSPRAKAALQEAAGRVETAAEVVRVLLAGPEERRVALRELVPALIAAVSPILKGKVAYRVDPIALERYRALSIGPILNELVTNAFRHGSPPVEVAIRQKAGECVLQVKDAGAKAAPDPSLGEHSGFGLRLVTELAEAALQGQFRIKKSKKGTAAVLRFPLLMGETGEQPSDTTRAENPCR